MKKWAYYNEHDAKTAEWIRELIKCGLIMQGEVDERSIEDVSPSDVAGFLRCHWFAGIAGWEYALKLAGWPDHRPVWTGSCPCQPFSTAGKGTGAADERHLWPAFHHLIRECKPPIVFGEQVEAAIKHGWLDLVQSDLEGIGYAFGAVGLPAASIGSPHIRQRLWFVAESDKQQRNGAGNARTRGRDESAICGELGNTHNTGPQRRKRDQLRECACELPFGATSNLSGMAHPLPSGWPERGSESGNGQTAGERESSGLADAERFACDKRHELAMQRGRENDTKQIGVGGSPWSNAIWIPCRDGKYRPVEPAPVGLADGLSDSLGYCCDADQAFFHPLIEKSKTKNRVGRLKGYGNAIVPQLAAEFIMAVNL